MTTSRALIIKCDDWIAMYVDGEIVEQGHELFNDSFVRFLKCAEKHRLRSDQIEDRYVTDEEDNYLADNGRFDDTYEDFLKNVAEYENVD